MTKRQDLEKEWLAVAELRLERLEEIRDLLSISPDADADEAVRIMKWWRETGDAPISAKLRSQGDRILRELHRLDEMKLEILDELVERNAGTNPKRPLNACCETLKIGWI